MRRRQNPCIKVGDIVLLYNEGAKRAFWRHAVAERLIKRADECVRAAVIRVSDEKGHVKLLQRSIQHLRDSSEDSTNELPPIDNTQSLSQGSTRPRCRAAVKGEIIRRWWINHHKDNIAH